MRRTSTQSDIIRYSNVQNNLTARIILIYLWVIRWFRPRNHYILAKVFSRCLVTKTWQFSIPEDSESNTPLDVDHVVGHILWPVLHISRVWSIGRLFWIGKPHHRYGKRNGFTLLFCITPSNRSHLTLTANVAWPSVLYMALFISWTLKPSLKVGPRRGILRTGFEQSIVE